jgi:tRNA A37 threonylcarbamoyltransferase TsaD
MKVKQDDGGFDFSRFKVLYSNHYINDELKEQSTKARKEKIAEAMKKVMVVTLTEQLRKTITRALKQSVKAIDFDFLRKQEKAMNSKRADKEVIPPPTLTQKIHNCFDPGSRIRQS